MKAIELLPPKQRRPSKAYLVKVNELRKVAFTWREQGYPGATSIIKG